MPGAADPAPRAGAGAAPLQPASNGAPQKGVASAPIKHPVGKLPPPRGGGGGSSGSSRSARKSPAFVRSATVSKAFLFSIWFNQLAQGLTALAPKTLGVYQVRSFFQGEREAQIGPATGALSAAFAASQLATQFLWGWASDYTGRPKMLILCANVGCGIGASWFAFATTYGEAMAARIIAGSFMASGVVLKAVLGLVLEKNAQAVAMAYRTLGAGCGQIVTPIIIGQLADPCTRWNMPHGCADGSFLRTHPFALSGAIIAVISTAAALLNFFIFPEIRTVDGGPVGTGARRKHAAAAKLSGPRRTASLQSEASASSESASRTRPAVPQSAFAAAAAAAPPRPAVDAAAPLPAPAPPARRLPSSVSFAPRPTVLTPPRAGATTTPAASLLTAPAGGSTAAAPPPHDGGVPAVAAAAAVPPAPPAAGLRTRRRSSIRSSINRATSRTQSTLASMRSAAAVRLEPARTALSTAATVWGFEGMAGADFGGEADLDRARAAAASVRRRMSSLRPPSAPSAQSPPRPSLPSAPPPPPRPSLPGDEESLEPPPPPPWWKHRPALLAVCAYAAVTFLFDAYLDLVNLYGSAPRTRVRADRTVPGLQLPVTKLSWIITLGGVCVVLFSLLAYPRLQRRIGVSRCATFGLLAGIPTALIPPFAFFAWPAGQGATLAVLAVGQIAYGLSFASTSTSSQILTNLCAPDGAIGSVNGAGNTLAAAIRVIGPMVTGCLWAIAARAVQSNDQFMPFGVLSGLFAVTACAYWMTGLSDADMSADR